MSPVDGKVWCPLSIVSSVLLQNNQITNWFDLLTDKFPHDRVGTFEASSLFFSCRCIQVILKLLACERGKASDF
jgi:hypothetical protein